MRAFVTSAFLLLCVAFGRADDFDPTQVPKMVFECVSNSAMLREAIDDFQSGSLRQKAPNYIGSLTACVMEKRGYMDEASGKLAADKIVAKIAEVGELYNKEKLTEYVESCVQEANGEGDKSQVALKYIDCALNKMKTGFFVPS